MYVCVCEPLCHTSRRVESFLIVIEFQSAWGGLCTRQISLPRRQSYKLSSTHTFQRGPLMLQNYI